MCCGALGEYLLCARHHFKNPTYVTIVSPCRSQRMEINNPYFAVKDTEAQKGLKLACGHTAKR